MFVITAAGEEQIPCDGVWWQASLFAGGQPTVDDGFGGIRRTWLDDLSWVDHQPGWLQGADELLSRVVETAAWRQRQVVMWGRLVDEPRLTAWWPVATAADLPLPVLADAWAALGRRYGVLFTSLGANLYRDGRDSVAWHSDRIANSSIEPLVAIVSLGEPRPFLLRRRGGGPSLAYEPGGGDLVVMGGRCQHDWEHTVPKVAAAGPRLSLTFRHDPPEDVPPPCVASRALATRGAQECHTPR